MGIFDSLSKNRSNDHADPEVADGGMATKVVQRILDIGIDGRGPFDSAHTLAEQAMRRRSDPERAIDDIVDSQIKLAAANGFVTGLGGFVTMPVALPANVVGFYILATRMAAAIAIVRGYDVADPSVRSALLLALVGSDADDILKKVGYASGGGLAALATRRMPAAVVMAVNKGVGFRLLTQMGRKTFGRLGRGVPFLGGAIGAGLDSFMFHKIARHVREEFPPRPAAGAVTAG